MTSKNNISKTENYVSTILEAEEQRPLTWKRQENFVDVLSRTPIQFLEMTDLDQGNRGNLKKKKANVKIVYVAGKGDGAGQHRRVRNRRCWICNRKRRPEVVIALIAIFFLFVLISVVIMSIYFAAPKKKQVDGAPTSNNTVTTPPTELRPTDETTLPTEENITSSTTLRATPTSPTGPTDSTSTSNTKPVSPDTQPVNTTLPSTPDISSTTMPVISSTTPFSTPVSTPDIPSTTVTSQSNVPESTKTSSIVPESSPTTQVPTSDYSTHSTPQNMTSSVQSTTSQSMTTDSPTSFTTRLIQQSTSVALTTLPYEPTTLYPEFTTIIEQTSANVPIFYMSGPFTFDEAAAACQGEGGDLAMREDIISAARIGYNRCSYGWLRDMHIAMIMQESYASLDCERGRVGPIYKAARDPDDKYSGAYCVKDTAPRPNLQELAIASNPTKSINWWVTTDPLDAFNIRHALATVTEGSDSFKYPLMASMKSVYTCCNSLNITHTQGGRNTYVEMRYSMSFLRKVVEIYHRELAPVKVFVHVSSNYETMMTFGAATTNKTRIIESLVELASSAGLDGLIMDYEPREDYTREHAAIYVNFLNEFEAAMRRKGMKLGTVISAWGILKFYDIFNNSNVDFYGSMSSTYYGTDVGKNKENVLNMLESINADRIEIGVGLMHDTDLIPNPKRNYRWNEDKFRDFISWLDEQGISRIHVYPGHWRSHKTSEEYFLKTLSDFSLK